MPQADQRVGEYVLDEMIGQGAYAQVWRAHHHMWSDEIVAVKIPVDPVYVANLRQEGIRIHRLSHPNIVRPIGFDPMADPPYLMSEFMAGGSLRPLIEQRKLSVSDSINILRQVLTAVQYGHDQGIIHGDIKPDNVLLEKSAASSGYAAPGSVKVTDFGIGVAAMATATGDAAGKIHAQRGGTLAYLATEQREGAQPDARSDIYAVGVMLFELLTGERPSGAELPSELNPQSPTALDEIFRRSYARRERRYASAKEFLEALPEEGGRSAPIVFTKPAEPIAPPPPPPPVQAEEDDDALLIGFRDDDDDEPVKLAPPPAPRQIETIEPISTAPEEDEPSPPQQHEFSQVQDPGDTRVGGIESEKQEVVPGETMTPEQSQGLTIPPVPSVPSRADRDAVFDEQANKQLRGSEDIRGVMRQFFESRDLDEGESNNIRLRLVKWANALVGGDSDFDQQIVLSRALARPVYQVTLATRIEHQETLESRMLDNSGGVCQEVLQRDDYRLLAHLSTEKFGPRTFDGAASAELRTLINELIHDAGQSGADAVQRQDLFIGRANVVVVDYQFEGTRQRAFMVGNALEIVSPNNPFSKIREDPTKRAATLLDGEHIRLGIKELRRGLDSKWQDKASVILTALRGKLAAAYIAEAKALSRTFGWLESLELTGKAGQLVTGNDEALQHATLVYKRTSRMQLAPGLLLTAVFLFIAVMNALDAKTPARDIVVYLLSNPFFLASIATVTATLWSWKVISTRMSRTDFAFYQAMLLPTLVGAILALAPEKFYVWKLHWQGDLICVLLLALVITADVLLFKYLRRYLIRAPAGEHLGGDEATILLQIETMLDQDWDRLAEHYVKLDPLYSYAGARTQLPSDFQAERVEPPPAPVAAPREAPPPKALPRESGNQDVDRLAKQVISRVNAGARALIPPGRMLITLLSEYTRSVDRQQLGMAQSNAQKIEQKGKDLADKLADFEQVCRSPLTLDSSSASVELRQLSEEMSQRPEEPDFATVRSFADRAKSFRADQAAAVAEMTRLLPEVQEALDRFKKL